ncbi:hybrid sensor histidine kinase/response regulator transcription factor [Aquimarina agarilytica]|uniref:hybrid sensor histidine kinase/response regulator transcription factor n=1 Tax=Aquimarina agarilytica TaxID=1087449 RepID=UPI0002883679|nr:hybrid sensor histidine kinase/response regulator transcription factor [Aquimarina agarilytica]
MIKHFTLLTLLFLISISPINGQSEVIFTSIDQEDGLSNNRIWSIKQDKDKFIWIATSNGLNRYDGTHIKTFNEQNSTISSNIIYDIYIDTNNTIWFATTKGLCNYDYSTDTFTSHINKASEAKNSLFNQVKKIHADTKGNLWLATKGGVSKFNIKNNRFYNFQLKIAGKPVRNMDIRSVIQDEHGDTYAGSFGRGLFKLDTQKQEFQRISSTNRSSRFIHDLLLLPNSRILLGTSGEGALIYDIKSKKYSNYFVENLKLENNVAIIRSLFLDKQSNLWLGSDGDGLFKIANYDSNAPTVVSYKNVPQRSSSLAGNAIYSVFQDADNDYWIGTAWNGINYLPYKKDFDFIFSDIKGDQTSKVLSIYKVDKKLYFGLDGDGLTEYNTATNKITQFKKNRPNYLGANTVQCMLQQKNTLWLGTFSDGLIKVDLKNYTYKQFKNNPLDEESISYNDIRGIKEDSKGNLWIATGGGGLNYFDIDRNRFVRFKHEYNDPTSISSNNITCIQLENNNLWVGSSEGGITLFDIVTRKAHQYKHDESNPNSISSNNVISLYKDAKGNLWAGTVGEGINRINFESGTVERFNSFKKLRKETVTAIIEDNEHRIWLSTKEGILSYDYESDNFLRFPGLAEKYHRNAIFKDSNGELFFGSTNGVVKFNPNDLKHKTKPSTVLLTDFKLFNKPVEIGSGILQKNITQADAIELKHHHDVITFEFTTLHYPISKMFEYDIKMENFDKDWRNIGTDNKVTYTNLAPGFYTFKVRSHRPGTSNDSEFSSINIKINKPFWLEWWAIIFYAILVALAFYIFRKYIIAWEKMKSNLELEKLSREKDLELGNLKQQFFTNISHEIRTPVTLILSSINNLLKEESFVDKKQLNPINTIRKNSTQLLNLVNKLLDYRKLENNATTLKISPSNWEAFCYEIFLSFKELANQKKIDLKFESKLKEPELWFDKMQMEKVVYNLISNALKFTDSNKLISLKLQEKNEHVELILKDEGIGISEKQLSKIFNRFYQPELKGRKYGAGFGLGLSISKEIINLHKGEIIVESTPNVGSTFTIKLKKGKNHLINADTLFIENEEENPENYIALNQDNTHTAPNNQTLPDNNEEIVVLVVEDNKDIREYIVSLINKNFTILEAADGKIGLEITKKQLPDLIISDVMMPNMDGIEMTTKIKSNINTSHIPILLLTARTTLIHQQEGYSVGAEDYILKPFNENILLSKIQSILRNRTFIRKRMNNDEIVNPNELSINEYDQKLLDKLIKLIEEHIDSEELNTKFITAKLGVSHSVIYKKIKALTGLSLIEFITEIRLKTARKLILESDATVIEACYKVGYSNRKYFSKLFKKRFGKTPSEYRKQRKEIFDDKFSDNNIIDIDDAIQ